MYHYNISWAKPCFWGNEQEYVLDALRSTWISGGKYVEQLERDFATFVGSRCALSASNGTATLHLAYLALDIKPNDEVVVPGFAFLAAANLALQMRARPVFAEVDPETWCVTAETVEKCLSPRTRAVVPVHTYGNVCPMDQIVELATQRRIAVIEDAAESLGSRYKGRMAGTFGTMGSFSFQATKTITTGEGGMLVTDDERLYDVIALYRSHGMLRKRYYWHELPGHNFRLTNLQAALGCAQLEKIDHISAARKQLHSSYLKRLTTIDGVTAQVYQPDVDAVLWAIAVKLDPDAFPQGRDRVIHQMAEAGIETRPGFYAPGMMPFYDCPALDVCDELSRQVISLPSYPALTEQDIDFVCDTLNHARR